MASLSLHLLPGGKEPLGKEVQGINEIQMFAPFSENWLPVRF
jgi:hypothetical protein